MDSNILKLLQVEEEEDHLFSGIKKGSLVSKASRLVVPGEEESVVLHKIPPKKKLAEKMAKCGLKKMSNDVEQCLSLCVEERMRGVISNLIKTVKTEMPSQGGGGSGAVVAQIPTSFGHELRACLRCRLVKTYDQFRESGCENCPFFQMEDDHERVVDCTTPNFTGIISVIEPTRSWAARWLRVGKFVPGCYTLAVSEALPSDLQNMCQDENVPYVPPKRI